MRGWKRPYSMEITIRITNIWNYLQNGGNKSITHENGYGWKQPRSVNYSSWKAKTANGCLAKKWWSYVETVINVTNEWNYIQIRGNVSWTDENSRARIQPWSMCCSSRENKNKPTGTRHESNQVLWKWIQVSPTYLIMFRREETAHERVAIASCENDQETWATSHGKQITGRVGARYEKGQLM